MSDVQEGKMYAVLAMALGLVGFVIVLLTKKDNQYAMYYAKQSLVLMIAAIVIGWIPIIGWLVILVLWIIGIVNAFSGEQKELPLIGKFAAKFNF